MPFPVDERHLLEAERQLGARLPESYRNALLKLNGGEVEHAEDRWYLHPVADTSDRKRLSRTANHVVRETAVARLWPRFPPAGIAIADDGSGNRLLFLLVDGVIDARVLRWDHETGSTEAVAADFAELARVV